MSKWLNAGTSEVMLPSGVRVKWEPTSIADLMVRGVLPGYLRSVAAQFTKGEARPLTPDEEAKWKDMVALLIRTSVREVAMPDEDFEPYLLSEEEVNDDDPRMPRTDLEAMQHMALHLRTPREVDATSRIAHMYSSLDEAAERGASQDELELLRQEIEIKASEYGRIIEKEHAHAMLAWGEFRRILRSVERGGDGEVVGRAPVQSARDQRSSRGSRPRRGTRKSVGRSPQSTAQA
jgi:hypothetical protein